MEIPFVPFILLIQWTTLLLQLVTGQNCNYYKELIFGEEYFITNPNYPSNYFPGTQCMWDFKTVTGTRIYVSCTTSIPATTNCIGDKLSISPTGNRLFVDAKILCGNVSYSVVSTATSLKIGIYSSLASRGGQFICSLTTIKDPSTPPPSNDATGCDCGWNPITRIVGGVETGLHEFPFMASLIYKGSHWCGANIVSDRFLLTAAHCVLRHDPADHFVLVGDHNLKLGNDTSSSAIYKVNAYEIYPQYVPDTQQNDIAIIQTATTIIFSPNVGPVCLPFRFTTQSFTGQTVTIVGWGSLEFTGPTSDTLQKANMQIISNADCSSMQSDRITNGDICTYSSESKDSCQMDSGGPVVWKDPSANRYQLIGITSRGVGCGAASPSINTRVTVFLEWIVSRTSVGYCIK